LFTEGKITQAQYVEGMKDLEDQGYDALTTINQLLRDIEKAYEDALSAASDELADYTDHMEHLSSVFDHYVNLLELTGRSKDYDAMGDFLSGKASVTKDRLDVASSYYEALLEE
jgi:hypothetical protein